MYSRRDFGKLALGAVPLAAACAAKIDSKVNGVRLGAQTYSFRDRPLDAAIDAMKDIGIGECELTMSHVEPAVPRGDEERAQLRKWRLETSLDHFKNIRRKLDDAGIHLFAYCYNMNDSFTDDEIDHGFQMTKAMGTDVITASSTLTAAKRIAPFAAKYKMRVAMHGHSGIRNPNEFAKPESFAQALRMSKYFRINLDIGHFWAAGYDPVAYLQEQHANIVCLHIKDRKRPDNGPNVPFGEGETPIKPVLRMLKQNKWPIPANVEYEYAGKDTVAEVRRCFQYMKDAVA